MLKDSLSIPPMLCISYNRILNDDFKERIDFFQRVFVVFVVNDIVHFVRVVALKHSLKGGHLIENYS